MSGNYAILAHGSSLATLESRIYQFRDKDIVWCGMNYFNPSESILYQIGKDFEIVFDCSTVDNNIEYEQKARLPRLREFLDRSPYKRYITLRTGRDNLFSLRQSIAPDFNETYKEKIIYGEDLSFDTNSFCVSLHLFIACLIKIGANKIILFGADGGGGANGNEVTNYYKPELILADKVLANNTSYNLVGDTNNVNSTFAPLMRSIFGTVPEILNCSPNSSYTAFRNISYEEVLKEI